MIRNRQFRDLQMQMQQHSEEQDALQHDRDFFAMIVDRINTRPTLRTNRSESHLPVSVPLRINISVMRISSRSCWIGVWT